jgi:hypothetical protein
MEKQKEFKRKDIVIAANDVPELTDNQKFDSRSSVPAIRDESANANIMMALKNNFPPELIGKMMDLQERNDANEARKAYFKAKAAFKLEVPSVVKDKKNTQYDSMYATEDALFNTVNPVLAKHGLEASFSFPKHEDPKFFLVRCTLSHELGHSEFVDADGPLDTSGSKNPLQQYKSTRTYLKKDSYAAITGIASGDQDDDGNKSGAGAELISTDQATEINDLITETGSNLKVFLKVAKAESVETILTSAYPMLIKKLNKKKSDMRQPGE